MPGFGRIPSKPDSRDYSMAKLEEMIERGEAVPVSWDVPRILNQGDTPHCVGFGTGGMLNTDDENHVDPHLDNEQCHDFYYEIKVAEGEPGLENGAEIRDALKIAKDKGWIKAYAGLTTIGEIESWLEKHGPVLVGTNWTEQMMTPDARFVVRPGGQPLGGHCWFQRGADGTYFLCVNSWGEDYGEKGTFKITTSDFMFLLQAGGEAWAVVQPVSNPVPEPKHRCRLFGWMRK